MRVIAHQCVLVMLLGCGADNSGNTEFKGTYGCQNDRVAHLEADNKALKDLVRKLTEINNRLIAERDGE